MNLELANRRVLIVAGLLAVGRSLAHSFAAEGATCFVYLTTKEEKECSSLAGDSNITVLQGSLTADALCDRAGQAFSFDSVDILVFSHAAVPMRNFSAFTDNEWHTTVIDQLKLASLAARFTTHGMVKRKHGRVIFISSCAGVGGATGCTELSALGMGLIGLCKSLSRELISYGITVNCIAHGLMDFEFESYADNLKKDYKKLAKYNGIQRLGNCSDITAGALFLASKVAEYMTGQTMHINGGLII